MSETKKTEKYIGENNYEMDLKSEGTKKKINLIGNKRNRSNSDIDENDIKICQFCLKQKNEEIFEYDSNNKQSLFDILSQKIKDTIFTNIIKEELDKIKIEKNNFVMCYDCLLKNIAKGGLQKIFSSDEGNTFGNKNIYENNEIRKQLDDILDIYSKNLNLYINSLTKLKDKSEKVINTAIELFKDVALRLMLDPKQNNKEKYNKIKLISNIDNEKNTFIEIKKNIDNCSQNLKNIINDIDNLLKDMISQEDLKKAIIEKIPQLKLINHTDNATESGTKNINKTEKENNNIGQKNNENNINFNKLLNQIKSGNPLKFPIFNQNIPDKNIFPPLSMKNFLQTFSEPPLSNNNMFMGNMPNFSANNNLMSNTFFPFFGNLANEPFMHLNLENQFLNKSNLSMNNDKQNMDNKTNNIFNMNNFSAPKLNSFLNRLNNNNNPNSLPSLKELENMFSIRKNICNNLINSNNLSNDVINNILPKTNPLLSPNFLSCPILNNNKCNFNLNQNLNQKLNTNNNPDTNKINSQINS